MKAPDMPQPVKVPPNTVVRGVVPIKTMYQYTIATHKSQDIYADIGGKIPLYFIDRMKL